MKKRDSEQCAKNQANFPQRALQFFSNVPASGFNSRRLLDQIEKKVASRYLRDNGHSVTVVARLMGEKRSTMGEKLKRWGLR